MATERSDARAAEAHRLLERARDERPSRPEADFNEARLTEKIDAPTAADDLEQLRAAQKLYRAFIAKAGDDPAYTDAVRAARERAEDIEQIIEFRSTAGK